MSEKITVSRKYFPNKKPPDKIRGPDILLIIMDVVVGAAVVVNECLYDCGALHNGDACNYGHAS